MKLHRIGKILLPIILAITVVVQPTAAVQAHAASMDGMSLSLAAKVESVSQKQVTPGLAETKFSYIGKDKYRNTCYMLSFHPGDPRVSLVAGTPHDNEKIGLSTVRNQAKAVMAEGKQVVAAINSDMYNMNNGDPWGVVVKNGKEVHPYAPIRTWWKFFGLKRDGTPVYGDRTVYEKNKESIWQAMGIHSVLVNSCRVVNPDHSKILAPRVAVGVRADSTVFFLMVDGRQAPYSRGLSLDGIAVMMRDLGAVWAGNMDGGGSATCLTKAQGSSALQVQNRPSDGNERAVANSWLFVVGAPQGGEMDTVEVCSAYDYYAPGSLIRFYPGTVRSSDGRPAELASSGLSWSLTPGSDGIINSCGTVTAGKDAGTVEAHLNLNGKSAGSRLVHIVQPDSLHARTSSYTLRPGESTALGITASYQGHSVAVSQSDLSYDIPAGLGTVDENGKFHTSPAPSSGDITVRLKGTDASVRIHVRINQLPDNVENCEYLKTDKLVAQRWAIHTNYRDAACDFGSTVSPVHTGKYAMRISYDFRPAKEAGNVAVNFGPRSARRSTGSPTALGVWVNGSHCHGVKLWGCVLNGNGKRVYISMPGTVNWNGWKYVELPIPADEKGPFQLYGWNALSFVGTAGQRGWAYVDDVQFVYGARGKDTAAPVIDSVSVDDKTYSNYQVDISASCHDNGASGCTSGVDSRQTELKVDGISYVSSKGYRDSKDDVSLIGMSWALGRHRVDISIQDSAGNYCCKTIYFTIQLGKQQS